MWNLSNTIAALDLRRQLQVMGRDEAGDIRAGAHGRIGHLQDQAHDRLRNRRLGVASARAGGDVAGQVPLPLEGLGHAQGGDDIAQVARHRLLTGEQHDAHVVDIPLQVVDALVGVDDLLGDDDVPVAQGLGGPFDRRRHLPGHGLQIRAELLELLVEDVSHEVAPDSVPGRGGRAARGPGACPPP